MMAIDPWMLLPDFALIALGWAMVRWTSLGREVFEPVERMVYHLLFPALLFVSITRQPIDLRTLGEVGGTGFAVVALGIAVVLPLARWPGVDRRRHASGAQCAFRFNSYVGLAVAERLAGAQGVTWLAMMMSICVPVCNIAAVWPLARHGGHGFARELLRNPLLVATLAGLAFNLAGLQLPGFAQITLQRIGAAALPLGLMAVGAGLRFGAMAAAPRLAGAILAIRHLLLPAFGIALAIGLGMPPAQQAVLVAFAALPTASSAYVLAARMGGDGGYVAGLITLSTLIGLAGVPLALAAWQAARALG